MTRKRFDFELLMVGLVALVINLVVAYLLVFRLNIFMPDALARASSALAVFFSGEPKLANIGFVWLPLPTLLQLPLILFPLFRDRGFSGNVVTAFTGAGTALMLTLMLRRAGVPRLMRWLFLAAFVLNPMILFYSANGMSEMTFVLCVFLAVYCYWLWRENRQWVYLTYVAVSTGLALMTRYEAVFVFAVFVVVVAIAALAWRPDNVQFSESAVLMYSAPLVYMGLLWILASWLIMGDPLFFARSVYSAAGYVTYYQVQEPWLLTLKGDLVATLRASVTEIWRLYPAFLILSASLLVVFLIRTTWDSIVTLALAWSPLFLLILNVYLAKVNLFTRYFFAVIPMSFLLAVAVIQPFSRWRAAVGFALAIVLGVSTVSTIQAMHQTPDWGYIHRSFVEGILTGQVNDSLDTELQMAKYISTQTTGRILVDNFEGNRIILFSSQPARFITTSDSIFKSVVSNPFGRTDFVLVFNPAQRGGQAGNVDLINQAYPELYKQGGDWVKLDRAIGDWRLYRIIGTPGQTTGASSSEQTAHP